MDIETLTSTIENTLNIRKHPDDILSDLSIIQDCINSMHPHLRRDIISFKYRPKWYNGNISNHTKLLHDIASLYDMYIIPEIKDKYDDFISKHRGRDLILYRGVYSTPSYDVLKWKQGDEIQQVFPMSTSIYADSPLLYSDTDDNTGVFISLRIPIDHGFLGIFTDNHIMNMSRDETKHLFKSGRLDSEVTLLPGTMKLDSKTTIHNLPVYHMSYSTYTYSEWIDEYVKYRP